MIQLRKFMLSDYEDIVDMYYSFTTEVYTDRTIGARYFFYKVIQEWINRGANIVVSTNEDIITGFSMCYKDSFNGITEPVYQCEIAYVKPEFRSGRSAYMLYNNSYRYAKELGLKISSNGRISNGVDKMMQKHFNLKSKFTILEGE